jgi:hypothetical protein
MQFLTGSSNGIIYLFQRNKEGNKEKQRYEDDTEGSMERRKKKVEFPSKVHKSESRTYCEKSFGIYNSHPLNNCKYHSS